MNLSNKLILGTVQFGLDYGINNPNGKLSEESSFNILNTAYLNNITTLDTAESYGNSIDIIGGFHLKEKKQFNIISKIGNIDNIKSLKNNVLNSISKLNADSIYAYLFHTPNDPELLNSKPELVNQLMELKENGLIKKVGISVYTNTDFEKAINNPLIEIIQFPFNVFDNNNKRFDLLKKAKQVGKELHCRSVFLQGLFFKELDSFPVKLAPLKNYLGILKDICNEMNLGMTELTLNYALINPFIDKVLIGVDSESQLIENISKINKKLQSSDFKIIDENINIKEEELLYPYNWNN